MKLENCLINKVDLTGIIVLKQMLKNIKECKIHKMNILLGHYWQFLYFWKLDKPIWMRNFTLEREVISRY